MPLAASGCAWLLLAAAIAAVGLLRECGKVLTRSSLGMCTLMFQQSRLSTGASDTWGWQVVHGVKRLMVLCMATIVVYEA